MPQINAYKRKKRILNAKFSYFRGTVTSGAQSEEEGGLGASALF